MDLTQLLLRLFVKDYRNTEDPAVRTRYGKLAGIVGIVRCAAVRECQSARARARRRNARTASAHPAV